MTEGILQGRGGEVGGIVRPARRPEGWMAPGPAPRGLDGRAWLWPGPGEDLCYLVGDWRIYQLQRGNRWSMDELVTAAVAVEALRVPPRQVVDLGCGVGSVLLMLAWAFPEAQCLGVEAQSVSVELCRKSIQFNGVDERVRVVEGDLRQRGGWDSVLCGGPVELMTGTPPYFEEGKGRMSEREQCAPCRFEQRGGIEAYCDAAAERLSEAGRFVVCESHLHTERVIRAAQASGLELVDVLEVVPRTGRAPLIDVYTLARPEAVVGQSATHRSIGVRTEQGQWTEAFQAMRARMGLPPAWRCG